MFAHRQVVGIAARQPSSASVGIDRTTPPARRRRTNRAQHEDMAHHHRPHPRRSNLIASPSVLDRRLDVG